MKSYSVLAQPDQEPIAVTDAAAFLRLAPSAEDLATLQALIAVARNFVEDYTGRALLSTSYLLATDSWTGGETEGGIDQLLLDRSPLQSVQSVTYIADGDTEQSELDSSEWVAITSTTPGRVLFLPDSLPALANRPDALQICFTAGHSTAAEIPPVLLHAIRLLVSNFYEQRAPINVGNITSELPLGLRHLLDSQRIGGWVA